MIGYSIKRHDRQDIKKREMIDWIFIKEKCQIADIQ